MKEFTAFDKDYWNYIACRWPQAYKEFKIYLAEADIISGHKDWVNFFERDREEQIKIFQMFTMQTSLPYPFNKFDKHSGKVQDDSGKIYEWLTTYSERRGYTMTRKDVEDAVVRQKIWNALTRDYRPFISA